MGWLEVTDVLIPLTVTGGALLTGLFVASAAANRHARAWRVEKETYRAIRSDIRKLKHTLQTVTAYEWPIWPRPLLFDAIDRHTQLSFARAEEALVAIRKIDSRMRNVPYHTNRLSPAYNVAKNVTIWRNARHNRRMLRKLRVQHQVLEEALQQITNNQLLVTRMQQQVDIDLKRFQVEYRKADEEYLSYLSDPTTAHYMEVANLYNEVRICLAAADEALSQPARVDGMNYAVAHFWQQAAVIYQSSFDAACLVHTYSDAYILDQTQQRINAIVNTLSSLDLARQSQDWLSMAKAYQLILHQKSAYALVLKSISEFEAQHEQCMAIKKQLTSLNLDELKLQAEQAEAELGEYFKPDQFPIFWQALLPDRGIPTLQIQQAQNRLAEEIASCTSSLILQSEITQKIAQANEFIDQLLSEVEVIAKNVHNILAATQEQKEAEAQVQQRFSPEGQTTRALQILEQFANASSEDVRQKYQLLKSAYEQYKSQAAARQGADYPALLVGLAALERECGAVKDEHAARIASLRAQAAALDNQVKSLQASAAALKTRQPQVEGAWEDIFERFEQVDQQVQSVDENHGLLVAYVQQAPGEIAWLSEEIEKINQIHSGFAQAKVNLNNHLSSAKKAVDEQISILTSSWALPMRDLLNDFKTFKNQYAGLRKAFLRLSNTTTMSNALAALDDLENQVTQVETQVKEKYEQSVQQQKQLNDLEKQGKTLIAKAHHLNIPFANVESAREILQSAHEKETYNEALTLLKWAVSILQSTDPSTGQPTLPGERGLSSRNRPGSTRMITSDYKKDVPPEKKDD